MRRGRDGAGPQPTTHSCFICKFLLPQPQVAKEESEEDMMERVFNTEEEEYLHSLFTSMDADGDGRCAWLWGKGLEDVCCGTNLQSQSGCWEAEFTSQLQFLP